MPAVLESVDRFNAVMGVSRFRPVTGVGTLVYYDQGISDYTYWLHDWRKNSLMAALNQGLIEEGFMTRANMGYHPTELACNFESTDCEGNYFDRCPDVQARLRRIAALLLVTTGDIERATKAKGNASQLETVEAACRAQGRLKELVWEDETPGLDYGMLYFADMQTGLLLTPAY